VSDRRKYLILMGAILAAVVGAVLLAVPGSPIHKKPVLGLDLQGGLEVVLKAVPPKGVKVDATGMTTAQAIIQSRIDKLGVSSPEVRKQGLNQIVVELAGVHDPAKAAALIGKTAQLMMFDFEADLTGPSTSANGTPVATPSLYDLLTQVQAQAAKGNPESYYLFRTKSVPAKTKKGTPTVAHSLLQGPAQTVKALLAPYGGKTPAGGQIFKVPAHTLVVSCPAANGCPGATAASGAQRPA
jgi:preprotein translocase subunit SecD